MIGNEFWLGLVFVATLIVVLDIFGFIDLLALVS